MDVPFDQKEVCTSAVNCSICAADAIAGIEEEFYLTTPEDRENALAEGTFKSPCRSSIELTVFTTHFHYETRLDASGGKSVTFKPIPEADQLGPTYIRFRMPALVAVPTDRCMQSFPCDNDRATFRRDRAAAIAISRSHKSSMTAGAFDTFSASNSTRDDIKRGFDMYLNKAYGQTGNVRSRQEFEGTDNGSVSGQSVATVQTRNPARQKYYAYRINGYGYRALEHMCWWFGNQAQESIPAIVNRVLLETYEKQGHLTGMRLLAGCAPEHLSGKDKLAWLIEQAAMPGDVTVGISHYSSRFSNKFINQCTSDWTPVCLHMKISSIQHLIKRSNKNVEVRNANTQKPIENSDLEVSVIQHYRYTDEQERAFLRSEPFDTLVPLHKVSRQWFNKQQNDVQSINMRFNYPTFGWTFVIQTQAAAQDNDWFNFNGLFGLPAIQSASVKLGTSTKQPDMPYFFYTALQNREQTDNIPILDNKMPVARYGFGESMIDCQVTGSFQALAYNPVTFDITPQEYLAQHDKVAVYGIQHLWMIIHHEETIMYRMFAPV